MEKLEIGTSKYTSVYFDPTLGPGGAHHDYKICATEYLEGSPQPVFCEVHFQNGPIKEAGVNGVMNEDLLAIVIDRLQGFQAGQFACRENAIALTKLEEAVLWLRKRTMDRERRGVEGTSVK